jgi:SlyX protein
MTDLAARLDTLEAHFAHQDRVITELNEVVTAQWRKIERLERQVLHLRDALQSQGPSRDAPEPPPPHY